MLIDKQLTGIFMVLFTRFSTMKGMIPALTQMISSNFNKESIWKIILITGYFLTSYNYLILFFHQPQGYVVDIYSALPLNFFLSLIICYTIGSVALFIREGNTRKLGIVLLVFNHFAVLIIPYMLGYYSMGRTDDMSYIGEYLHISTSGNLAGWDIYPASHIIGAALSIGTGIAPHLVSFILPVIFSFLFVGGLIFISRLFLEDTVLVNIAIASSFILYLGPYNFLNVPHALFFAIMPLYLFILSRFIINQNFSNILLIYPFTFLVPFMHPFIVLFVVSIFLALLIFSSIQKKFMNVNYRQTSYLLLSLIFGFTSWVLYGSNLLDDFRISYLTYLQKITEPVFFETTDKLARINIDLYKIIRLVTLYYGRYVIPFLIIIVALILIYLKRDRISQVLKNRLAFGIYLYIIFFFIELMLFFNPIISHQPDRLTNLNFVVYAQVPLFVLSLYVIFMKPHSSIFKMVLLLLILSSMWGLSLFSTFDSPNIFRTNVAISNNEVQGMQWFYESRTTENVFVPLSQINRFHHLLADGGVDMAWDVPDHFGYGNNNRSFAEINLYPGERNYFILLTLDEFLYQKVPGFMEVGRYNAGDFHRFRNDNSINKIFDDMNIEIYW
jgi:hypothetical protein